MVLSVHFFFFKYSFTLKLSDCTKVSLRDVFQDSSVIYKSIKILYHHLGIFSFNVNPVKKFKRILGQKNVNMLFITCFTYFIKKIFILKQNSKKHPAEE